MPLRQKLNENQGLVIGVVIAIIVIAVIIIFMNMGGPERVGGAVFFTDDDGKTWFSADESALSPMEHDGKQAYRAYVFECPDGNEFVGYMERLPDEIIALMKKAREDPNSVTDPEKGKLMAASQMRQVKKPGEEKWVRAGPIGPKITCPDGSVATIAD